MVTPLCFADEFLTQKKQPYFSVKRKNKQMNKYIYIYSGKLRNRIWMPVRYSSSFSFTFSFLLRVICCLLRFAGRIEEAVMIKFLLLYCLHELLGRAIGLSGRILAGRPWTAREFHVQPVSQPWRVWPPVA